MDRPSLVASDVDGTLLDPLERVTERTARAIANVAASSTPFVLVTGRPPRWIPPIARAADLSGYAVCANGAVVYDIGADRVLSVRGLDPIQLGDLARAISRVLPDVTVGTERAAIGSATVRAFAAEPGFLNPWGDPEGVAEENNIEPRAEVLGHTATKLLVRHPDMTSREIAEIAGTVLDGTMEITYSTNRGLIEISAGGVTKASGLAEVCDRFGLDAADVIAFGDMPNDTDMLCWAGHGVAMANAHPEVLAVADEITAANSDDGVAQVLERWF